MLRLDEVLGADRDVATGERRDLTLGKVAKSAVSSLIPFRSVIREITGAADHKRNFEDAILAGAIRRGFLKGLGEARGCPYPARPAFARIEVGRDDEVANGSAPERIDNPAGADEIETRPQERRRARSRREKHPGRLRARRAGY